MSCMSLIVAPALRLLGDVVARPPREREDRPRRILVGLRDERPPSATKRFFTSCAWQFALTTDVFGSLPMRAPPSSWMIVPAGGDAVAALLSSACAIEHRAAHLGDERAEGLLHVLHLVELVVGPLPVEAEHRNAELVDDVAGRSRSTCRRSGSSRRGREADRRAVIRR